MESNFCNFDSIKNLKKKYPNIPYGEPALRKMAANSELPGIYTPKGFKVNVQAALEMFDNMSRVNCKAVN